MEIELMKNARPLTMPVGLLMELDRNGASVDVYRELEDLYPTAKGYAFSWGQIIESDSCASEGLPDVSRMGIYTYGPAGPLSCGLAETWARFPISA